MDTELKSKWTAALRSGAFKQCTGELYCKTESGEEAELAFTLVMAGLADASEQQTGTKP